MDTFVPEMAMERRMMVCKIDPPQGMYPQKAGGSTAVPTPCILRKDSANIIA